MSDDKEAMVMAQVQSELAAAAAQDFVTVRVFNVGRPCLKTIAGV